MLVLNMLWLNHGTELLKIMKRFRLLLNLFSVGSERTKPNKLEDKNPTSLPLDALGAGDCPWRVGVAWLAGGKQQPQTTQL